MKKANIITSVFLILTGTNAILMTQVATTMLKNGTKKTFRKITLHHRPKKPTHFVHEGPEETILNFQPGQRINILHQKGEHVIAIVRLHDKKTPEDINHFFHYSNQHWHFRYPYTLREFPDQEVSILILKEDKHGQRYIEALR